MLQDHIDLLSVFDNNGLCAMHEGRYVMVREVGEESEGSEWYLILSESLESALAYCGPEDDGMVWSATPYLTRAEAIDEAFKVLAT